MFLGLGSILSPPEPSAAAAESSYSPTPAAANSSVHPSASSPRTARPLTEPTTFFVTFLLVPILLIEGEVWCQVRLPPPAPSMLGDGTRSRVWWSAVRAGGLAGGMSRRPCSPSNSRVLSFLRPPWSTRGARSGWPRAMRPSLQRRCRMWAVGSGGQARASLGVGPGVFDAVYRCIPPLWATCR